MENFFMAGLNQDSIMREGKNRKDGMTPEILFSMYGSEDSHNMYLQYIFPHKIRLAHFPDPPQFHTFECENSDGNISFFHCLKFQEELDLYQIEEDFDYEGPMMQLKLQKYR
jgi:hypothetical protein